MSEHCDVVDPVTPADRHAASCVDEARCRSTGTFTSSVGCACCPDRARTLWSGPQIRHQADGRLNAMKTTIDAAGRLVVPKPLRDQLGLSPGTELEAQAVDGRLEVAIPSRVRVEDSPHGVRFVADAAESLSAAQVRKVMEQSRR